MRRGRAPMAAGALALGAVALLVGCSDDDGDVAVEGPTSAPGDGPTSTTGDDVGDAEQRFPDVVAVEATPTDGEAVRFDVTISSPYDSPERYADAWRVLAPDGTVLGIRELTHDHADEQPFTRSDTFDVPADVAEVTVEGRDLANGWGGTTRTVAIPGR